MMPVTKLEMTFSTRGEGRRLRQEQRPAPAPHPHGRGGAGGAARRGEQMHLQFPHISKSQPCASRSQRHLEHQSKACRRLRAQHSPGATAAGEVRDGADVQRARSHAPRFFGSVGNASLDSLPSSHNRVRGENLEAAGWNLWALFSLK